MSARVEPSFDRFGREIHAALAADRVGNVRAAAVYYRRAAKAAMNEQVAFWCACRSYVVRAEPRKGVLGAPPSVRTTAPVRVS